MFNYSKDKENIVTVSFPAESLVEDSALNKASNKIKYQTK